MKRHLLHKTIVFLIINIFGVGIVNAQSIMKNEESILIDSKTAKELAIVIENLNGHWELTHTVNYIKGDTIVITPTYQEWAKPEAKAFTKIKIDSLHNFEISKECMKCPYLGWKGKYAIEIKTINDTNQYYINFVDDREEYYMKKLKKRYTSLTEEYNGIIIKLEPEKLVIRDKFGVDWVYRRCKTEN